MTMRIYPQVPDGVDDRTSGEMDHTFLRSQPSQLTVRGQQPPHMGEIGRDLTEVHTDDDVLYQIHAIQYHIYIDIYFYKRMGMSIMYE